MVKATKVEDRWELVGDDGDLDDANEFLVWLAASGRSSYTQRSYAIALASFLAWLAARERPLLSVDRPLIVAMLAEWGSSRAPATVNHRLAVLGSLFSWLIERDADGGPWAGRRSPVPVRDRSPSHRMAGRDAAPRERVDLRRRKPVSIPRTLTTAECSALIAAAPSPRDRALLMMLLRTGARIGDWIADDDRHGILGLAVGDIDLERGWVVVRLKGNRRDHRVPMTSDVVEAWRSYRSALQDDPQWAWSGQRRGAGRPLRYPAFAAMLSATGLRAGVTVHAHMFRHTLAQAIVEHAGVHAAQGVLGHVSIATTADRYARTDETAVVAAVADAARRARQRRAVAFDGACGAWVFAYDDTTIAVLDSLVDGL